MKNKKTILHIILLLEKSIILPTQYEINEYQIMVEFIDIINNLGAKDNLHRLIQGKGAFGFFF